MTNSTPNRCPKCGGEIPPDARAGLCPRCLFAMNLASETQMPSEEMGPGGTKIAKPPPQEPPSPDEIARHFPQLEVLECLGRGGMGVVYKARQPQLNRLVALKLLAPEKKDDPQFAERFLREAQALAQLSHPNIVTIYDFGQTNGLFYLLMEFVDGITLRKLLETSRVSSREALAIVPQICDALQYAHDQGVVHRDIKPENILLGRRGQVKVADFGLAKLVGTGQSTAAGEAGSAEGSPVLTEAGKIMGTPQYMAPEQRQNPAEVDHRADIYALGVVFYQMLTGELPGKRIEPPSKKVQIDVRLDEVVLRALEKEPERRYQQASQIKGDVETIATTAPATSSAREPAPTSASDRSQPASPAADSKPRFSRVAIIGAITVPFSVMPIIWLINVFTEYATRTTPGTSATWGSMLLTIMFFVALTLTGPVVTTILGWIAISQIGRSSGRLRGLKLALFDGLVFPLLAINAMIFGLWMIAAKMIAVHFLHNHSSLFVSLWDAGLWSVVALGSIAWTDTGIVRWAWSAVTTGSPGKSGAGVSKSSFLSWAAFCFGLSSGVLGGATWFFMPHPPQPLVWSILATALLGVALGLKSWSCWPGKQGCIVGGVNTAIWLIVAVLGWIFIPHQAGKKADSAKAVAPFHLHAPHSVSHAPFLAQLSESSIELVALRLQSSATNQPAWRPDGTPFTEPLPAETGGNWAEGKIIREIVFRVRSKIQDVSIADLGLEPEHLVHAQGSSHYREATSVSGLTCIHALACSPEATNVNVRIGVATGPWETVITIGKVGGHTAMAGEGGRWEAGVDCIEGTDHNIAASFRYTVNRTNATRMVAIKTDGSLEPVHFTSLTSNASGDQQNGMVAFTAKEAAQIKEFQLQRRPYQWVWFNNVSLVPGQRTAVMVEDARDTTAKTLASFGPVTEKLVVGTLDFESSTLADLPLPQPLGETDQARYDWFNDDPNAFPWMRQRGVDLIDLGNHGLMAIDMLIMPLEKSESKTLTPDALRNKLRSRAGLPHTGRAPSFSNFGNMSGTYGFQTREGSVGILQCIDDPNLPLGVKIRYKMAQP